MNSFPDHFSYSSLSLFSLCPRKWAEKYLREKEESSPLPDSIHITFGKAFAFGCQHTREAYFVDKTDEETAIAIGCCALAFAFGEASPPEDSTPSTAIKTLDNCIAALIAYFTDFPLSSDAFRPAIFQEKLAVEFTFFLPWGIPHPETGDPLAFKGVFDVLSTTGTGDSKLYLPLDEKTAGRLGSDWAAQWQFDSQFTGYIYAISELFGNCPGAVIRGITPRGETTQIYITRTKHQIGEWLRSTEFLVRSMIAMYERALTHDYPISVFPCSPFKSACRSYSSSCPFISTCIYGDNHA